MGLSIPKESNVMTNNIQLAGYTLYRQDRTAASGKTKGGGLFIFVNKSRCTISKEVSRFCSPEVEYLMTICRPHYLQESFHLNSSQMSIYHHKPMLALRPHSMSCIRPQANRTTLIQRRRSQWPGTLMQGNLNLFYHISTSMLNVQPKGKETLDHLYSTHRIQNSPSLSIWQI